MMEIPDLKLIHERFWNAIKDNEEKYKNYFPEFLMYVFPQTWGSTALGFEGIGGQAITSAYTTVVIDELFGWSGVFFGERLAYVIYNPNQHFFEDLKNGTMQPVYRKSRYLRRNDEQEVTE